MNNLATEKAERCSGGMCDGCGHLEWHLGEALEGDGLIYPSIQQAVRGITAKRPDFIRGEGGKKSIDIFYFYFGDK